MKNLKQLKKNSGFTIVELLIGIGVIVGFLAFVYGVYSRISSSNHANTMTGDLTTFQTKIHEVYANDPTGYSSITTAGVITAKAYPGDLNVNGTTSLTSTFAGVVTVGTTASNVFTITYDAVPNTVCAAVANKLASSGEWVSIAGGKDGKTEIYSATTTPTKASIEAACGTSGTAKMIFTSN